MSRQTYTQNVHTQTKYVSKVYINILNPKKVKIKTLFRSYAQKNHFQRAKTTKYQNLKRQHTAKNFKDEILKLK